MIRVPSALTGAVRRLSQLHRQGHTVALLQGLEELISKFDSNIDIDVADSNFSVRQLEMRLEKLESHLIDRNQSVETKLEAIAKHLEKLERVMASGRYNSARPRSSAYSYQQQGVELQPKANENLAQRLAVSPQSLVAERENKSAQEFLSWTRNRDPMSVGWEFDSKDGLYNPVK